MNTGLIWFRVAVIGFALFQVAMVLFSTLPLIEMGATGAVLPAIIASLIGSVVGCFMVLYPVELLYRTYEGLMKAPYLNKCCKTNPPKRTK